MGGLRTDSCRGGGRQRTQHHAACGCCVRELPVGPNICRLRSSEGALRTLHTPAARMPAAQRRAPPDCWLLYLTPQLPQANSSNERPSRMRPSGPSAGNTDLGLPALTLEALGLRHGQGGAGATRVSSGRPSNSSVGGPASTAAALLGSHGRSSSAGGGPTPGVSASGVDPAVVPGAGVGGVRSRQPSGVGSGAPGGTSPSHAGRVRSQVAQVGGPGCGGVAGKGLDVSRAA